MPPSARPQPLDAPDAARRARARRALALSMLAVGTASGVAAACGPRDTSDAPVRAASDRADGRVTDALLPPGAYRVRARGVNTYMDTFPLPGVLRIDPKATGYVNATLELDPGPNGLRTGTYDGSVRARGDSAKVSLACDKCRIQTRFGESYADLTYAGEFGVRALGGGRFVLTEWTAPGRPGAPPVDTLVRVDR